MHGVFVHAEGLVRIGLTGFPGFDMGAVLLRVLLHISWKQIGENTVSASLFWHS